MPMEALGSQTGAQADVEQFVPDLRSVADSPILQFATSPLSLLEVIMQWTDFSNTTQHLQESS